MKLLRRNKKGAAKPAVGEPDTINKTVRKLAAAAYGEASTSDIPDEIAGIAWTITNRARAWPNKTVDQMLAHPGYVLAIGNERYTKLMKASEKEILADKGIATALESAKNAIDKKGTDPSNGAFWWDGKDFWAKNNKHYRANHGYHFADPAHNLSNVPEVKKVICKKGKKKNKKTGEIMCVNDLVVCDYVWESTAAYGKTVFWRYNPEFVKNSGTKEYR